MTIRPDDFDPYPPARTPRPFATVCSMTVVETALIFAAIPLGVLAVIVFLVYGRSALHQPNRYRPGKPWPYAPAWYVPHPDALEGAVPERVAIEGSSGATKWAGGANGEW